jgi:hypothetical protein
MFWITIITPRVLFEFSAEKLFWAWNRAMVLSKFHLQVPTNIWLNYLLPPNAIFQAPVLWEYCFQVLRIRAGKYHLPAFLMASLQKGSSLTLTLWKFQKVDSSNHPLIMWIFLRIGWLCSHQHSSWVHRALAKRVTFIYRFWPRTFHIQSDTWACLAGFTGLAVTFLHKRLAMGEGYQSFAVNLGSAL